MNKIAVTLKDNPYDIIIGQNLLVQVSALIKDLPLGRDAVVITDPHIRSLHGKTLTKGLKKGGFSVKVFEVPAGERSKSAKVAFDVMERIARFDVFKKIFIIAFGGGVIGDLAGFVAATYKRGVPYIQIPTTLLAQIDSAIGGKVAVDLAVGKNLVGAFYQPKIVISDVDVLKSLDAAQIRNGLAEAIKYGIIEDKNLFEYISRHRKSILESRTEQLCHIVEVSSHIKTKVVVQDEKETKGIRTILNFGHTIGHAIEAAGGYKEYQHGEAVALGMRVAVEISSRQKMLAQSDADAINLLITQVGLPARIKKIELNNILAVMKYDKKFIAGRNRFVLACKIGQIKIVENIPLAVIKESVKKFMDR